MENTRRQDGIPGRSDTTVSWTLIWGITLFCSFGDGEFKPLGVTAEPEIRHRIINGQYTRPVPMYRSRLTY